MNITCYQHGSSETNIHTCQEGLQAILSGSEWTNPHDVAMTKDQGRDYEAEKIAMPSRSYEEVNV